MLSHRTDACHRFVTQIAAVLLTLAMPILGHTETIQDLLKELRGPGHRRPGLAEELGLIARAAQEGGREGFAADIVAGLLEALCSDDAELRRSAADGLGHAGPKAAAKAATPLRALLSDADVETRAAAASALVRLGVPSEEVLPTLTQALAASPSRAIHALAELGPAAAPAVDAMLALLAPGAEPWVIEPLTAAVAKIAPTRLPELERRAAAVREHQVSMLIARLRSLHGAGAEQDLASLGAAAVPALIAVLKERPKAGGRVTYGETGTAPDNARAMVVITPVSSLAHVPRVRAAQALGRIGPAAAPAVPTLLEALQDPVEPLDVQAAAAQALGRIQIDPERVVPALASALERDAASAWTSLRLVAAEALGLYGHHAARTAPALSKARRAETNPVARAIIDQALDRVRRPSADQLAAAARAREANVTLGLKTFADPVSRIGFEYPENYVLVEHRAPDGELIWASIKEKSAEEADAALVLSIDDEPPPRSSASWDDFAVRQAQLHCDADGPEGSTHCPEVARVVPFAGHHAVAGLEIHLVEVDERRGRSTRRTKAPVFAIDVSSGVRRVLLLSATRQSEAERRHIDALRNISYTVRLQRGEPEPRSDRR